METIWKYASPISREEINKIATENNFTLPNDLIDIIEKGNNGYPSVSKFDTANSNGRVFKTLLSYYKDDIENVYEAIEVLKDSLHNLFPIASDPSGNFICLEDGLVVLWLHETDDVEFIASSTSEFVSMLY